MFKKILSTVLVATFLVGYSYVPTKAANSTDEDGTLQSTVIAQIASSWVVTVPDSIVLDANKSATYSISISGDVANDTSISVIPESSFTLTDGESDVTANVTQEKQQWIGSEIESTGSSTTGTIAVNNTMTAGTWSGSLNFLVNCTEDLGDLLAKVEMMQTLDIYCMGDSIVDGYVGYGNGYYGTSEAIDSLYGTNSYKSYAISGATLTEVSDNLPNVIQQTYGLYGRLQNTGYDSNKVIIFNGGYNDIVLSKREPDKYNVTVKDWAEDKENGHYDIASSLTFIDYLLSNSDGLTDVNAPIIYIVGKCNEIDAELTQIKEIMVSLQKNDSDILIVDLREFIEDTDMIDGKHLNSSGQTKLAHKIVDVLYDYYN